ncbi:MAG: hypothetical protein ACRD2T_06780, partial [Thermoanaerobaculia bacterium]
AAAASSRDLWRTVLRVAWLAIGLGIALEVLLLTVAAYTGTQGSSPRPFVADLVHKVSWSFLVCVGLALGTVAGKARSAVMGFLGLVSAPLAFATSKALHKGAAEALGLAAAAGGPSPLLIALLKAVEYGVLGAALGRLGKRARGRVGGYVGLGLLTGFVFGGAMIVVTVAAGAKADLASLLARGINEVLFPVGCSLVLYASEAIGKRLAPS